MAVPTIIRVLPRGAGVGTPARGPTAGSQLVEVFGAGFRLPPIPTGLDPDAVSPQTVAVTFGGESAPVVRVARSNLLRVVTPPSPLAFSDTLTGNAENPQFVGHQGTVDVVVTNLDDAGAPIPGETATAAGAYTYLLPPLGTTGASVVTRVTDAVVALWRRDVLQNVMTAQSVEFESDTTDGLGRVDIAKTPAIVVAGPRMAENRDAAQFIERIADVHPGVNPDGHHLLMRPTMTVDLEYDVLGIAESRVQLLNLMASAARFVHRTPFLFVQRDPGDASRGTARHDHGFPNANAFTVDSTSNESDLHVFRGAVRVVGVEIEQLEFLGHEAFDAVPDLETVVVGYSGT